MISNNIEARVRLTLNTDPQRRCYNGCHAKAEKRWTGWEILEIGISSNRVDGRLKFWRELNAYAVSQRGKGARTEFRVVPTEVLNKEN